MVAICVALRKYPSSRQNVTTLLLSNKIGIIRFFLFLFFCFLLLLFHVIYVPPTDTLPLFLLSD